jgi:hypothetical protein
MDKLVADLAALIPPPEQAEKMVSEEEKARAEYREEIRGLNSQKYGSY